jgi:ATP synthase F1 delta subunit
MPAAVSSRYARALADVVLAPNAAIGPDRVRDDLRSFEQALAASPELSTVLASPGISRPRKRAVVDRLVQSLGLSGIARNFLRVLVDHRRTAHLSAIADAFEKIVDERLGTLQVEVASASAAGRADPPARGYNRQEDLPRSQDRQRLGRRHSSAARLHGLRWLSARPTRSPRPAIACRITKQR